jgi:hypothetical protein
MRIQMSRAFVPLAATVLLAAGCGIANPFAPSNAAAKSNAEQLALKWAQCMRAHGVNVSDPGPNGAIRITATGSPNSSGGDGGKTVSGGGGGGGSNTNGGGPPPEIQAAMDACKQYQPSGGRNSGPPSQQQIDAATKFAQCMRDHGIPMEDPQTSGGGVRIGSSPGTINPDSDQFKKAQAACQHYLDQAKPKS